ncbi:haloacid dehalogenase [Streptomyces sulfonofaciens]|uniref:Haloacid dehalogenase n=1 Tax=Streptomyces sulfonofaciens TaxID=68272 RepID=A0A919L855_9ACTN|nr:HAD family phosphatase [Streptomyces sulfonofaciens]GHH87492.1 haloacid dehalogenase [Streptomyces sulfonofaciens]
MSGPAAAAGTGGARPPAGPDHPWLVFDYGEVISDHQDVRPRLAELLGAPLAAFCAAWAAERAAYDRGATDLDYWQSVGERVARPVDEPLAARLTAVDFGGWSGTRPDAVALLGELAAHGVRLALLSNAPRSHARRFRAQPWAAYFHHLLFSGELGTAKPDRAVWDALGERLGARPGDCLFLDDRYENVDGARRAGLGAVHWTGTEAGRRRLTALGLLPRRTAGPDDRPR